MPLNKYPIADSTDAADAIVPRCLRGLKLRQRRYSDRIHACRRLLQWEIKVGSATYIWNGTLHYSWMSRSRISGPCKTAVQHRIHIVRFLT